MNIKEVFNDHTLNFARLISFSKSTYRKCYPNNKVVFNSRVYTLEDGEVWYGDLDLTLDEEKLKNVSKVIAKDLYVLFESSVIFKENLTIDEIKSNAYALINKDKIQILKQY